MPRTRCLAMPLPRATLRIDERAQVVEAIRSDESGSDQFPKRGLDLGLQLAGAAHNVGEKRSATLLQQRVDIARALRQAAQLRVVIRTARADGHPVGFFADEESDGSDGSRDD